MPEHMTPAPADASPGTACVDTPIAHLRTTTLRQIRQAIEPQRYRRSPWRALAWMVFDLGVYGAFIAGVFLAEATWLKLLFGLGAGCGVAMLFVWAHDAAHGSLFRSSRVSEVLGTLCMLPSLNMFRLWSHGHNRIHHGFTSFTPMDWIWRPWTPEEYAAASSGRRLLYRLERTPYLCALHYLVRVWWDAMIRFRPDKPGRATNLMRLNKLITLVFALAFGALAWSFGGGWIGVLAGLVVPFLVFNYFIALFIYLHHTHPEIPFFRNRDEWSQSVGQIYCSTVVRCSPLSELLTHNILIHVPHHVSPAIPFYRLKQAYEDLRRTYGEHIHEYRFRWKTVRDIFRRCKLYDYQQHCWYTFADVPALVASVPTVPEAAMRPFPAQRPD